MNRLAEVAGLHNQYFVMRHGVSVPNMRGIIVSSPKTGPKPWYGLVESAREDIRSAVLGSALLESEAPLIFSSDFSRTLETAEIVAQTLRARGAILATQLRERNFGELDMTSNENYGIVWKLDQDDPTHEKFGVESAENVQERATGLILDMEASYIGRTILLVTHGDTGQLLETGFRKVDAALHRGMVPLEPAEIRPLQLAA